MDSVKLTSDDERNFLYVSVTVLALNAVFSTRLRDGIPEWGRVSPFDCLYALLHHIARILVQTGVRDARQTVITVNGYSRNEVRPEQHPSPPSGPFSSPEARQIVAASAYPASVLAILRALNATAGVAFLFVMTRATFPWTKTFACSYQLYWLLSCKLLPQPITAAGSDPITHQKCRLIANWGFSTTSALLIWYLWSPDLHHYSSLELCLYFFLHYLIFAAATIIACLPPSPGLRGGVIEASLYVCHMVMFVPAWLSTLWPKANGRDNRIYVSSVFAYDFALCPFVIAKGEMWEAHRWPAAVLAICHLGFMIILVEQRPFQF